MTKSGRFMPHDTHMTLSSIKPILRTVAFILLAALLAPPACVRYQSSGGQAEPDDPYFANFPIYAELTPERAEITDNLSTYFERMNRAGFNGTVLFAENGEIVFAKAYGYCNLQQKDSLSLESSFQLASVSKPITALAVLILEEEKKLSVDDTITRYLPGLPYEGITIRHLLSHRSGLPNYMYFCEDYWTDKEGAVSNEEMIHLMIRHSPKRYYLPDRRYNYSNTNYALLASIVERVSEMPFETFVKKRIFEPLQMKNAMIYNKAAQPSNDNPVLGYVSSRLVAENNFLNGVVGDKGVYASAFDLLKLDQALYTDKLVSQETLKKAFEPQHKDLRPNDNYGLGWRLDVSDELNPVVYHTGWWKGFRTYFIRELSEKRTIIILSNTLKASRFNTRELRELF
ncbi:MAG: beta-lactamase family protein [Bacteroidales bacterium]|nr:beta-lactamase family protein [Bacteroidales bacterium]MDD2569723.1 serine hydrolase [Bacteroidales bacterium]MDD2811876.1 serine hydrolase [Bacteroidales bacterium]MDD3384175.1 serine hydrolase [Bacteroidales bacterium]MDD3870813.1 serine hydrolase [Bacteroidales bacterium]